MGLFDNFDWRKTLGTVAPGLATAVLGPLGGLATKAIVDALGLPQDASEAQIAQAIKMASPDQLLALKKADQDFSLQMERIGVDLSKIDADDRDSARKRQTETKDHAPEVLGGIIILGFLTAVGFVLAGQVDGLKDPLQAALVGTLIGYVSAKADQVVAYYFGSNSASKKKDQTIANLTK